MVCKEDVVTWFKELTSHKRIDVMCSLLNMCLPFELRFLGTCLEDLGKRDFHELREVENRANNVSELADLQCISDKRTQRKIALYLAFLHSCNHACSNGLYKILANCDFGEINTLTNNSSEENPLDELLVLYTLAINHPAFSYEQKLVFGNILMKLQEEESRLNASRHHPVGMGLVYVKPLQPCVPSPPSEDRGLQDVGVLAPCTGVSITPIHPAGVTITPVHPAGGDLKGRTSIPPGLSLPTGLSIPSEQQLTPATGYVQVTFPAGAPQPMQGVPWPSTGAPIMLTSLCDVSGAGEVSPYPSSPLMSRQSSPSQSGSPSRTGSPVRATDRNQQTFKAPLPSSRRGERNLNSTTHRQQNCSDPATTVVPSSVQQSQRTATRKNSTEPPDSLRETLGKEMPNYLQNLQKYTADELRQMCDEDLKELGLPHGAIHQLRSIVTKLNSTNGLSSLDKRDTAPLSTRRKPEPMETEVIPERKTQSAGPVVRRYTGLPMEGAPMVYPPPPLVAAPPAASCFACIALPVSATARYQQQHNQAQQIYCMNHNMRNLRLDGSHSSSASDSSSTSHSPPDTPSMPTTPHWERGYMSKEASTVERWSPGCDDRLDKERRIPESGEKPSGVDEGNGAPQQQQTLHNSAMSNNNNNNNNTNNNNNRPRLPGGLGRSKSNPPGLQTIPRGRGPVILEGNHKSLPSCRREGPAMNGTQPPPVRSSHPPTPPHEDRKMFLVPTEMVHYSAVNSTTQPPPPQYTGGNSSGSNPQQQPRPGDSNVPYTAATAFLPHGHFPALRSTGSIFPTFAPSSYMRPTFPFTPNGELVYQYQCPQTPPPPPPPTAFIHTPVVTYSTVVPPPKLSCYNCGSQSHHATDCKEPTMEEVTKPGQYRIDYSSYQKPGDCSTEK